MSALHFLTQEAAIQAVCTGIKSQLEADIKAKGAASLILTGGTTVQPFLSALAEMPIEWSKVWVVLSDERWVPVDDNASNEKQLKMLFLDKLASKPHYISLKTGHKAPYEAIPDLEACLKEVPKPVSASLLSMGEDGHVASLFPAENWGKEFSFGTSKGVSRLSLSLAYFKHALSNFLLITKSRESVFENIVKMREKIHAINHFKTCPIIF